MLAAESLGYLSDVARATEIILDEDGLELEDDADGELPRPPLIAGAPKGADVASWRHEVNSLASGRALSDRLHENWPSKRELLYQIDVQSSLVAGSLVIALETRDRKADGTHTPSNRATIKRGQLRSLPLADREIVSLLAGGFEYHGWGDAEGYGQLPPSNLLTPALAAILLPRIVHTGRAFLRKPKQAAVPVPLEWDSEEPWRFELQMTEREITGWNVKGLLRRGEERVELAEVALVTEGFVFIANKVSRLSPDSQTHWVEHMRRIGAIAASDKDGEALMAELLTCVSSL